MGILLAVATAMVAPLSFAPSQRIASADYTAILEDASYQVAPGLYFRTWLQDASGVRNRGYLLTASIDEPTLAMRYLWAGTLTNRSATAGITAAHGAAAAVNASFFDINSTGAPLGTAVVDGSIVYASADNMPAMVIDADGQVDIETLRMKPITGTGIPAVDNLIVSFNSPQIPDGGIGMFDSQWRYTMGTRVLSKTCCSLTEVLVQDGIVVGKASNVGAFPISNPLSDGIAIATNQRVLIAHGTAAKTLADSVSVGQAINLPVELTGTATSALHQPFRFALSAPRRLLTDGAKNPEVDTSGQAPRTAIGYDEDFRKLMLLVVDGRSSDSAGLTENGLAMLMRDNLGAEDALNLDGGGSSTMVARFRGAPYLWNRPSDGGQRPVPNAIGFISSAPDPTR